MQAYVPKSPYFHINHRHFDIVKDPLPLSVLEIRDLWIVDQTNILDEASFGDFAFAGGEPGCTVVNKRETWPSAPIRPFDRGYHTYVVG